MKFWINTQLLFHRILFLPFGRRLNWRSHTFSRPDSRHPKGYLAMAKSKSQIAFEDRLSSLKVEIETYYAADNDSIKHQTSLFFQFEPRSWCWTEQKIRSRTWRSAAPQPKTIKIQIKIEMKGHIFLRRSPVLTMLIQSQPVKASSLSRADVARNQGRKGTSTTPSADLFWQNERQKGRVRGLVLVGGTQKSIINSRKTRFISWIFIVLPAKIDETQCVSRKPLNFANFIIRWRFPKHPKHCIP